MGGSGYVKSKSIRIATNNGRPRNRKSHSEYAKSTSPTTVSYPFPSISTASTPVSSTAPTAARMSPSGKTFYAGAKFETHPKAGALPPPPIHWTTPNNRSQPSSPTNKTAPAVIISTTTTTTATIKPTTPTSTTARFTPIDLMALFASSTTAAAVTVVNKPVVTNATAATAAVH